MRYARDMQARSVRTALAALSLALFAVPAVALAQEGASVVVAIDGQNQITPDTPGGLLYTYLGLVLKWASGLIGALLLCFLVYYGFVLMFSGVSDDQVKHAKEGLMATLGGVILFLTSGLVLYTLNPVFFCGFGGGGCGGTVMGEPGPGGNTQPPSSAQPPSSTPPSTGADIVALCESPSTPTRGNGESISFRADMTPQNVSRILGTFGTEIQDALRQPGIDSRVTDRLIASMIMNESAGNPNVSSSSVGAIGLMQIMPATGQGSCGMSEADLRVPAKNIKCGTKVVSGFIQRAGSVRAGIAAYSGGMLANQSSTSCADQYDANGKKGGSRQAKRWECLWDNSAHTQRNTGYKETRDYITRMGQAAGACVT